LLAAQWRDEGLPSDFPCVLISRAAQPDQHVKFTTLARLGDDEAAVAPSLLIAGWAMQKVFTAAVTNSFEEQECQNPK